MEMSSQIMTPCNVIRGGESGHVFLGGKPKRNRYRGQTLNVHTGLNRGMI